MPPPPSPRTVAVFGAGIAGLSAAHELSRLGHRVSVYEATADAGGFFRSARSEGVGTMPSEFSEFNLTLFAEEQVWQPSLKLGTRVESLSTAMAALDRRG